MPRLYEEAWDGASDKLPRNKQQGRAFGPALLTHSTFREPLKSSLQVRRRSFTPANQHTVWLLHFCTEDTYTLPELPSPTSHQYW